MVKWSEWVSCHLPPLHTGLATVIFLSQSITKLFTCGTNPFVHSQRSRQDCRPEAGSCLVKGPPSTFSSMAFTITQFPDSTRSLSSSPPVVTSGWLPGTPRWSCHHHSLFKGHNVNVKIVVLNCQKCNQCLKSQVTSLWDCCLRVRLCLL